MATVNSRAEMKSVFISSGDGKRSLSIDGNGAGDVPCSCHPSEEVHKDLS